MIVGLFALLLHQRTLPWGPAEDDGCVKWTVIDGFEKSNPKAPAWSHRSVSWTVVVATFWVSARVVDWSAALGGDLLHMGEGVQLVSRRTQLTDFGAYTGDSDFLCKKVSTNVSVRRLVDL